MALNLKELLVPLIDLGSETYEERVRKMIVFGGLIVLVLIVIWKRS